MRDRDNDGKGRWAYAAIDARYAAAVKKAGERPRQLVPDVASYIAQRGWLSAKMDEVFKGMRNGDRNCAWLAIELIEEDGGFAFGKLIKARAARELKCFKLNEQQKQRIRARVVTMLERQFMPHEFKQYVRLLRRVGPGPYKADLERLTLSPHRWVRFFAHIALGRDPGRKPLSDWYLRKHGED